MTNNIKTDEEIWDEAGLDELRLAWETPPSNWDGVLRSDHAEFNDLRRHLRIVDETVQASPLGEALVRESFMGLYVPGGELIEQPDPTVGYLKPLFEMAQQLPEWDILRKATQNDSTLAAFGTASFVREFGAHLPDELKKKIEETRKLAEQAQKAREELEQIRDAMFDAQGNPQAHERLKQQEREAQQNLQNLLDQLAEQQQQLQQSLQENQGQVNQAIARSSQQAQEETGDIQDAMNQFRSFGLQQGAPRRQKIQTLERMAKFFRDNEHMKLLLDTLGWAQGVIQAEMRQSLIGRETIVEIRGQELDLENLQPDEMMGLLAPKSSVLWTDAMIRLGSDELLHRRYEGEERVGRGPLVVVHDKSGSMSGEPNAITSAILLALILELQKQNRRVVSIPFSGPAEWKVFEAIPGKTSLEEIIEHIEFGWWGGTEPYGPLEAALSILQGDPNMKRGDILIITDGAFYKAGEGFLKKLNEAREKPGLKLTAVVIASDPGSADFADRVIRIDNLVGDVQAMAEAMREVL